MLSQMRIERSAPRFELARPLGTIAGGSAGGRDLRRDAHDNRPVADHAADDTKPAQSGASILIVEDEALNALYITSVLEVCGYNVVGVAATASGALEAAADRVPDLVLMDITLRGDIDGIAAARSLQERLDVPILFVTAHADAPTLERARATNPVGYLIKPFTSRQLETAVEDALSNASARKAGGQQSSDDARQRQNDDDDNDNTDDPEDVSRH